MSGGGIAGRLERGLFPKAPSETDELETIEAGYRELGLTSHSAKALAESLGEGEPGGGPVPFWLARNIESELGALGYGKSKPLGHVREADARRLYAAVRSDLDRFFENTDEGAVMGPKLAEAKQKYKIGLALYNESKAAALLDAPEPEKAIRAMFTPGNVTAVYDMRQMVPDKVFDQSVQGWMQGLYEQASKPLLAGEAEGFSEARFAALLKPYNRNGHLQALVGTDKARELNALAGVFRHGADIADRAGRSSGTMERKTAIAQMAAMFDAFHSVISGQPERAAADLGATIGIPAVLGRMTTSPLGQRTLLNMPTPLAPWGVPMRGSALPPQGQGLLGAQGAAQAGPDLGTLLQMLGIGR